MEKGEAIPVNVTIGKFVFGPQGNDVTVETAFGTTLRPLGDAGLDGGWEEDFVRDLALFMRTNDVFKENLKESTLTLLGDVVIENQNKSVSDGIYKEKMEIRE
jgi:hypothetical protein